MRLLLYGATLASYVRKAEGAGIASLAPETEEASVACFEADLVAEAL